MQFPPTPKCDRAMTEAEQAALAELSPEDIDELARETPEEFAQRVKPDFEWAPHVQELWDELYPLTQRPIKRTRLVVCWPPRHGKTTSVLLMLAYLASTRPIRIGYASYSTKMTEKKAAELRRYFEAAGVKCVGTLEQMTIPATAATITLRGIGAGWTGLGYDVLVCDDPLDGREDAESVPIREGRFEAIQADFLSRMDKPNEAGVVLIQTRWHLEDPAGRAIKGDLGEPYKLTLRRALSESGESLWPARFPVSELAIIRARGEYNWWSLYQQEPRPRGTELFREPKRYDLAEWLRTMQPEQWRWGIAVDPAATEKTYADHSVALLMAVQGQGDTAEARIVAVERGQWEVPALCERVKRLRNEWLVRRVNAHIYAEGVGGFKAVAQILRRMLPEEFVREVTVKGDKFTRALPVSGAWNTGRVLVPSEAPWADTFIQECCRFTGVADGQDDQVDALAHAWNAPGMWQRRPALVRNVRKISLHGLG